MKQKQLYTVTVREQYISDNGAHVSQVVMRVVDEEYLEWLKKRSQELRTNWEHREIVCYRESSKLEREWKKHNKGTNLLHTLIMGAFGL